MTRSEPDLLPEQVSILRADSPVLVVSAGAGAGKTRILVELYCRRIEEGLSPDEVLTITFTRKAAAEMKARIVRRLREMGKVAAAQIAETGPIQTVHAFCDRILRENAVAAGVDPQFEILGDGESLRLREACIRSAIAECDNEHAVHLVRGLAGKRAFSSSLAHGFLIDAVGQVMNSARLLGASRTALRDAHDDPAEILTRWRQMLLEALPGAPGIPLDSPDFLDALRSAHRAGGGGIPVYLRGACNADSERRAASQTCGVAALATDAWRRLDEQMADRQQFDFTALESRAVRLLAESEATRERLSHQYKAILLDEVQDVNPVQHRLIDSIRNESKVMVGDNRQSIYGFRFADLSEFERQKDSGLLMSLSENHRSSPGIVGFVNHLFARIWPAEAPMTKGEAPAQGPFDGVEIWLQKDEDIGAISREVSRLIDEGESPGDIAVLVRTAQYGHRLMAHFERSAIPCRIVGGTERFYARMEIRDLANTLRALTSPQDDFALLAALRGPAARLSIDSIALLALRGPVMEAMLDFVAPLEADRERLTAFNQWFQPLRKVADRLTAWEVIAEILARSSFLEGLASHRSGRQQIANIRKLLKIATEQPELGAAEFAEQIREIQGLKHREGDAPVRERKEDLVEIMTIHKAKGLQFPVVIVPQMHREFKPGSRDVELDPKTGLFVAGFLGAKTPYGKFLERRRADEEREEELRILYVALTRAERRLFIVAHGSTGRDCLAKMVAKNLELDRADELGLNKRDLSSSDE